MYNEIEILKNASLILDNNDIVKSAGFVQNISNFLKRLVSPEYRDRVEELTNKFDDVRGLLSDLNTATQNVQDAIQSADVDTYEQNLNEVRILIKHLSERLGQMEESAEKASVVPSIEKPKEETKPGEEISKIPEILERYKQRHAIGYDMPMSDSINKPYQDFEHLKRAKVVISDKSKLFNLRRFFTHELRKVNFPIEVFGDSKKIDALFNALIKGIYDGIVISNQYAIESKDPPPDPAEGLTRVVVQTPNVEVPELNLSFKAEVVLNDFGAQIRHRAELSIFRIPHIWDVKYSGEAPSIIPKTKSGKKALFLIVPEYSQNEESKKDIAQIKEELKKKHNVDEVIDATADKVDILTKHFVDEGYDIVGIEQYKPKMSVRINALKKIAWWDPDKPAKAPAAPATSATIANLGTAEHKWARNILKAAFEKVMNREPTLTELQLAQAVALGESHYGLGWKGQGAGSNNWGAIQCVDCPNKGKPIAPGQCPPGSFYQQDSIPTTSGKNKIFHWCYKSYPTPEAGAADLIKTIFTTNWKNRGGLTLGAAENKSITDFSTAMYDSNYYGGFGKTREDRIGSHVKMMNKNLNIISEALDEKPEFEDFGGGTQMIQPKKEPEESLIERLERMLWASTNGSQLNHVVKNAIARKLLPKSNVLIITKEAGDDFINVLCTSLHKLFGAELSTRKNGNKTEINCIVAGNEKVVTDAVQAVCDCVSEGYQIINKQLIKTAVYPLMQMRK